MNGKTTYYINDSLNQGHTVLNEIQSNGKVTKSLVHGPTGLLAEVIGEDKIRYIHKDRQGSTVMLTNGGAILSKYYYDAYGEPHVFYEIPDYVAVTAKTVYDGEKTTNYLYTGQEYDVETGLYYYNARYYDPTKGSFISKDPMRGYLGDLLSRNRYTYVKNNPFKYTDPSGNFASEGESYYGYLASIHPQFAGGLYRANPLATDQSGCGVIMSCDNSSSYSYTSSSSSSPNFTPAPKPEFDLKSGSAYSYTPEVEDKKYQTSSYLMNPLYYLENPEFIYNKGEVVIYDFTSITWESSEYIADKGSTTHDFSSITNVDDIINAGIMMGLSKTVLGWFGRSSLRQEDIVPQNVIDQIPPEWGNGKPSSKGEGWVWQDPKNPHNQIRFSKGKNTPKQPPGQRVDNVKVKIDGQYRDINGNIVPKKSQPSHIPSGQFKL